MRSTQLIVCLEDKSRFSNLYLGGKNKIVRKEKLSREPFRCLLSRTIEFSLWCIPNIQINARKPTFPSNPFVYHCEHRAHAYVTSCLFYRRMGHWHINGINLGKGIHRPVKRPYVQTNRGKKKEKRNYAVFEYLSQGCALGAIVVGFHGARRRTCNHNLFRGGLQGVLNSNSALILWKIVKRRWGDYKFRLIRYSNIRAPFAILTRGIHVIIWWPTVELQIEIKDSGG